MGIPVEKRGSPGLIVATKCRSYDTLLALLATPFVRGQDVVRRMIVDVGRRALTTWAETNSGP